MAGLKLTLLGPPSIELDGVPVNLNRQKALAILSYLAVTETPQRRATLTTMFWPEDPPARARSSLRRDLSILNKALNGAWLEIDRTTVDLKRTDLWLDVHHFTRCLAACSDHGHTADAVCSACLPALQEAVDVVHGDFMTGFTLAGCPAFDEWQFFEGEALRQQYASALSRLIRGYMAQDEERAALPLARRWVALDPLHEPAQRALMRLYAKTDQRSAALRQYRLCAETLADELGVPPAPETTALYTRILTADESPSTATILELPTQATPPPSAANAPSNNLPTPATPFVGRVEALTETIKRLSDPLCRLLTITGPGGIGKTRLAIQASHHVVTEALSDIGCRDGLYFVRLSAIESASQLTSAIAEGLSLSFYADTPPQEQLFHYLHGREMLLVLDNFEHLLPSEADQQHVANAAHARQFITDLLASAPQLKLIVTSREALNLPQEWIYPLEGLRTPPLAAAAEEDGYLSGASYSAIQLFSQHARRVRPDFSLREEWACVVRICHLVEGMPLALELAASWARILPCSEIAGEIERNLDFLATSQHGVAARHRSMRAVFEPSWALLQPDEQVVLQRLAVFHSGFRQIVAKEVAGASLLTLASLVDKSLLRSLPASGRYLMHELLRQFLLDKLGQNPAEYDQAIARHSHYYLEFMAAHTAALADRNQQEALSAIRPEIQNVRSAWRHVVQQQDVTALLLALDSLYAFYRISSRFQEGADTFHATIEALKEADSADLLVGKLTAREGAFQASLGLYGLARELLQKSLSMARRLEAKSEIAFSLNLLGNVLEVQGEREEALLLYEESLQISQELGDQPAIAGSLHNLGGAAVNQGDFAHAKSRFGQSLARYQMLESQAGTAHVLDSLGMTNYLLGDYREADASFDAALARFEALDDRRGKARALSGLAKVALARGGSELARAQALAGESLAINREIGYRVEVARQLILLGEIALAEDDDKDAEVHLQEGLAIAQQIGFSAGTPVALDWLGQVYLKRDDLERAAAYCREALELVLEGHTVPALLSTLVTCAAWLVAHAQATRATDAATADEGNAALHRARRILQAVAHHPAAWETIQSRADAHLAALPTSEQTAVTTPARPQLSVEELAVELLLEEFTQ